jgi:hypothetical protein
MDSAAMDNGIMSNRNIIAYVDRPFLISTMDDGPVLDVDIIPYPDVMNITSYNCVEPYTAIISYDNITGDGRIIGQETMISEPWENSFYCFDQCHWSGYISRSLSYPASFIVSRKPKDNPGNNAGPCFHDVPGLL